MYAKKQHKQATTRIIQPSERKNVQQLNMSGNQISTTQKLLNHCRFVSQLFDSFDRNEAKKKFANSFISEKHFDNINENCKNHEYVLSIREAGEDSIKRLEEGARPKPHSILDKSIKKERLGGQLEKDGSNKDMVSGVSYEDIKGYVGYWDKGQLKGIIVAADIMDMIGDYLDSPEDSCLNLCDIKKIDDRYYVDLEKFKELKKHEEYRKCLYTGDYDLHEVYNESGNLIHEGEEKAKMLKNLNRRNPKSNGEDMADRIAADKNGILINIPTYAYFQHGDQATYRESMHNEANSKSKSKDLDVVELVPAVSVEETGRLAWFNKGTAWYISNGIGDHKEVRKKIGNVTPPKTWEEDGPDRTNEGTQITRPYIKPYPEYKYGRDNEYYKSDFKISPSFSASQDLIEIIRKKHENYFKDKELEIAKAKAFNIITNALQKKNSEHYHYYKMINGYIFINWYKEYCVIVNEKKEITHIGKEQNYSDQFDLNFDKTDEYFDGFVS